MAARRTAAAMLGFHEFQGKVPFAKEDLVRDQLGILACMDHMAGPAALTAVLSVDMKVMQVLFPVPETGRKGRRWEPEQVAVMTAEAELEFVIRVTHIELGRE